TTSRHSSPRRSGCRRLSPPTRSQGAAGRCGPSPSHLLSQTTTRTPALQIEDAMTTAAIRRQDADDSIRVLNPYDQAVVGEVRFSGAADIGSTVLRARKVQAGFRHSQPYERRALLEALAAR